MERGSSGSGGVLLHLDIHVDEEKPSLGILELLDTLRPQWKTKDIQMKASGSYNCLIKCNVLIVKTMLYLLINQSTNHSIHSSNPFIGLSVPVSVCLSLRLLVCPGVCWFVSVHVYLSLPVFVCPFQCLWVYLAMVGLWFTDFKSHINWYIFTFYI